MPLRYRSAARRRVVPVAMGLIALGFSLQAASQALAQSSREAPSEWDIFLGAGVGYAPKYLGADEYRIVPVPLVNITWRDTVFLSAGDGLGVNVINSGGFKAGPIVSYAFGREARGDIRRMKDVDGSIVAGGFVSYEAKYFAAEAKVLQVVGLGDMKGLQASAGVKLQGQIAERLHGSIGPSITWGSKDWNRSLFGVSNSDSARSGLSTYRPDSGFQSVGLGGSLTYAFNETFSLTALAQAERLVDEAAKSPIVKDVGSRNQFFGGLVLGVRF